MDVRLPRLGEGADSGTVASIFVKVGDRINKDQPVLELESEKAVASIPSPSAGTITAMHVKEGDLIKVGQLIFSVDEGNAPAPAPRHTPDEIEESAPVNPGEETEGEATEGVGPHDGRGQVHEMEEAETQGLETAPPPGPARTAPRHDGGQAPQGTNPAASPTVRKLAREVGLDLSRVRGSERGGRIVMADVRRHIQWLQQRAAQPAGKSALQGPVSATSAGRGREAETGAPAPVPQRPRPAPQSVNFSKWGPVHAEKMSTTRKTISARMAESWNAIPHVTQFDEADITALMKLRKKHGPRFEKKKAHLTLTPPILKAVVKTLQKYPAFNASIDEAGGTIVYKDYYHIGIAVDTEQGLIVPVIRDVDRKSLLDLALELENLAERTRERKVSLEEMQGGSFTISNQGGIGSGPFTPIINRPEVAILGIARGTEKMLYRKSKLSRRTVLPLGLSYDHRLIDGADAARFMVELVRNIESLTDKDFK